MKAPEHGSFHWNELMTDDVEKAKTFFGETVGWTFDEFPMGESTYWVAKAGGKPVGGIMSLKGKAPEGTPPHWMSYLTVDDVDARAKQITGAGGKLLHEPFDVPMVGRIAIVADPTGAAMGWITPAIHDTEKEWRYVRPS